jgi:RNA 2',3'-cyclic 3'-phosphodiesterase
LEEAPGLLSDQPEAVRAFVAVGIPDLQRERLAPYLATCKELTPGFRWVAPEGLHLTLRFLGRVERDPLEAFAAALRVLALEPFQVRLDGLGAFGRAGAARVLWLGVRAGSEELRRLAGAVENCAAAAGFEREERPFNPHLTLARSRQTRGEPLPALPPVPELPGWRATAFRLYRSHLGPGGATYSVLEEFGG